MRVRKRLAFLVAGTGIVLAAGATVLIGTELAAPTQQAVGPPPPELGAETVEIPSESGCQLKGWLILRPSGKGGVVLMHGIHAHRLAMLPRARFLSDAGYSVLLFDFQAHGESMGAHQTFGHLESLDARAAVGYLKARIPGEPVAVIGSSLGGAAALLGPAPLDVRALVLERE